MEKFYIYGIFAIILFFPLSVFGALTDNLVSYWDLDEVSGTRSDSHGSNTLTDNNTVGSSVGILGNGAEFTYANSEWLSISDGGQSGLDITGDMSLSFWLDPDANANTTGIAGKDSAGTNRSWFLQTETTGPRFRFKISSDGTTDVSKTIDYDYNTGLKHYVFVYDASAGTVELFVNATSIGTMTGFPNSIYNSTGVFNIGAVNDFYYHDGLIDEFGIWSRTLTTDEIDDLYNGGSGFAYPFTVGGGDSGIASSSPLSQYEYDMLASTTAEMTAQQTIFFGFVLMFMVFFGFLFFFRK